MTTPFRGRATASHMLILGMAVLLLTITPPAASAALPRADPDHFLLIAECAPAPDEIDLSHGTGDVRARPLAANPSRLAAEIPRAAMDRDGSLNLRPSTDQPRMTRWGLYLLPGWPSNIADGKGANWLRGQSLCFAEGRGALPNRVTLDRYPPVAVEFDDGGIRSMQVAGEELLGGAPSGFCIGDTLEPLEGIAHGSTGAANLIYEDPESPSNTLRVSATRTESDRLRFECTYTADEPRDKAVPVHLVIRPGTDLRDLRTYNWRAGGDPSQSVHRLPGAGRRGAEYAALAQTPFARVKLDNGAWLGALDNEQTNVILSAGRDANTQPFVSVSVYLWPREAGREYTWTFELVGGWSGDYNALLQALAPHTADFEEQYSGAMVNQERIGDIRAAHDQGARVLWHHAWFHRNGDYFNPTRPFDEVYQTVRDTPFSYQQLESNIETCHAADVQCNVYFQFAGVSEDVSDQFSDSLVRDPDGETVLAGHDGDYPNLWANPDPQATWGSSVLRQIDELLEATDADGIALDRTDRLDFRYMPDVYDYSSFNGYSSISRYNGSRQPVSSLTIAGREWMEQLRAILDRHDAGLISNLPISPAVVGLSDGVLIDQPMTPDSMFFMKALSNGKSLYFLDVAREIESPSDEPLEARLAQARPFLQQGGSWTDPGRMGRLLYAVSEGPNYPTLWYFDNGHTRMQYDGEAQTVPAMYAGSRFVPRAGAGQAEDATIARGGAGATGARTLGPTDTPAEIFAELPRFGASVFTREAATTERLAEPSEQPREGAEQDATATEAVPPTYVIGPGDELALRVWTGAIEHVNATPAVDADGNIYVRLIGAVNVGGETISEVRTDLKRRFAKFFDRAEITIGLARTRVIEVRVTGDVTRPGKYRLSGAATVFSALYAAGGPGDIGSLRRIKLIPRGGGTTEIDLYDYLLSGDTSGDLPLGPDDTVFVAPAGPTVGIAGQIQRPARYELTEATTLPEFIEMAAGLAAAGYTRGVQVWRAGPTGERELLNVDLSDPEDADFQVQGGDLVIIPSILEEPRNTVEVAGPIRRPGSYQYHQGLTVGDLLEMAQGLTLEAHMEEAYLWRLNEDLDYEVSSIDLRDALHGTQAQDPILAPGDRLVVLSENEVEAPMLVNIEGAVRNPHEIVWKQGMRVSDLVKQAGGLVEGAYTPRANLMRIGEDERRELIPVDLGAAVAGDPEANITLERGDTLEVLDRREVAEASRVRVTGLVQNTGWFDRPQGMRVSDAILAAGGLAANAANEVEYTPGGVMGQVEPIYLVLQRDGDTFTVEPDPVVRDNDLIAVLGAGAMVAAPPSVTIRGRVERPGSYALQSTAENPDSVYDLIERAGGLLSDANPNGIVLYRLREEIIANEQEEDLKQVISHFNRELSASSIEGEEQRAAGTAAQVSQGLQAALSEGGNTVVIPPRRLSNRQWARAVPIDGETLIATEGVREDFPLADGDVVVVPKTPTTVTVMGAVVRPGAIPYREELDPINYIKQAGDFTTDAVKRRTVVIRANGEVTPQALHTDIRPGDIILVPSDYIFRDVNGPGTLERVLNAVTAIVGGYLIFN